MILKPHELRFPFRKRKLIRFNALPNNRKQFLRSSRLQARHIRFSSFRPSGNKLRNRIWGAYLCKLKTFHLNCSMRVICFKSLILVFLLMFLLHWQKKPVWQDLTNSFLFLGVQIRVLSSEFWVSNDRLNVSLSEEIDLEVRSEAILAYFLLQIKVRWLHMLKSLIYKQICHRCEHSFLK